MGARVCGVCVVCVECVCAGLSDHIIDWVSAFTADTEFLTCVDEFTQRYASEFKSEGKDEGEDGSAFTLRYATPHR